MFLGQYTIGSTLTFTVQTHSPDTGDVAPSDSAPEYRVYEDETATPILTGTMAALDEDNATGFYSEQISITAANGFEVGKSYTIRVHAIVASVVAAKLFHFQCVAVPLFTTVNTSGGLPACDASGRVDVNVEAINGDATNGHNATLSLKSLSIVNDNGHAIVATGGGDPESEAHGIIATGGGSGSGIRAVAGNTQGDAFYCDGTPGDAGFVVQGGQSSAMSIMALGPSPAVRIAGNDSADPPSDIEVKRLDGSIGRINVPVSITDEAVAAVWAKLTSELSTPGSIGKLLVDRIDAAISSRLAGSSYTAPDNDGIGAIKAKTDQLNFADGDVKATLDGETVSVGDKTGFKLAPDGLDQISIEPPSGEPTTLPELLADRIDAAISDAIGGGGDATEAKQDQILSILQATPVTVTRLVEHGAHIDIVQGDDFTDGRLKISATWTGESLAEATWTWTAMPLSDYKAGTGTAVEVTCTATFDGEDITITVPLTTAQTANMEAVTGAHQPNYRWQLYAVVDGKPHYLVKRGTMTVVKAVA